MSIASGIKQVLVFNLSLFFSLSIGHEKLVKDLNLTMSSCDSFNAKIGMRTTRCNSLTSYVTLF